MKATHTIRILAAVLLVGNFAACGGDNEEVGPPDTALPDTSTDTGDTGTPDADDTGTPDTSDTGTPDAADTTDTTDTNTTDVTDVGDTGSPDVVDTGDTSADTEPEVCDDPSGCWACTPTNQNQLLNGCTDVAGVRFDNAARLPLLNDDGTLPPLP